MYYSENCNMWSFSIDIFLNSLNCCSLVAVLLYYEKQEGKYVLILLDIMLPEIDGFELMDYIRPLGIPVIF